MLQRYEVLGCKGFKGEIDKVVYDSTTLFVRLPVSSRSGTEAGFNAKEVKFGKEEEFQKLKNLPFPVMADLELEITTKGIECYGFKAVAQANSKPAA